jgi:uncharacterized protein (TIGR03083 family)
MTDQDQQLVDTLEEVWRSIDALGSTLSEAQWKTETECPGWTVQDNVAHVVGLEARLAGRPDPEHDVPDLPHIKNDIGRSNEIAVDLRRSRSGAEVLDEFREVTAERIAALRAMTDDDFAAESWTPAGPGTVRDLLPFRIFDSWAHEQDIRRALALPGDLEGRPAELSVGRIVGALPYVVGKKVKPPDGTTVAFAWDSRTTDLVMEGGRANPLDTAPGEPDVRLTMGVDTLIRLGLGRGDPAEILAAGAVTIAGDKELGRRIVHEMNFLF